MYVPAEAFNDEQSFPSALLDLLTGTIVSAVNRPTPNLKSIKISSQKIIRRISQIDSVKPLGLDYMPYLLNQLGLIYMSAAADNRSVDNFKTIGNLFETALKYQNKFCSPPTSAAFTFISDSSTTVRRFIWPVIPELIFAPPSAIIIRHRNISANIPIPTTTVIFATRNFPAFITITGNKPKTCRLCAIRFTSFANANGYSLRRNFRVLELYSGQPRLSSSQPRPSDQERRHLPAGRQRLSQPAKIITENRQPLLWAQIQEKIAEVYYLEGKTAANREALQEALACYHDARYIFETLKHEAAACRSEPALPKPDRLRPKPIPATRIRSGCNLISDHRPIRHTIYRAFPRLPHQYSRFSSAYA